MMRPLKSIFPQGRYRAGSGRRAKRSRLSEMRARKGILCSLTVLFFLLALSPAVWSQKQADKGTLLSDLHKSAKIECVQCHKDKPGAPVATAVCSGCHPNVAKGEKIRENLANPHNAHMEYPDCSECHHVHKVSENQCAGCHNFGFRMR